MQQDFRTFMSFAEPDLAQEIITILTDGKILHDFYDSRKDFNPAFNNSELGKEILIQLLPADFKKAEALVNEKMPLREEEIDPDYFLFGFTDEELKDVVRSADEWHVLDVKLAKHLLSKKGITVSTEELESFRKQQLVEKAKPEHIETIWLVLAYISAMALGPFGLLIGWYLVTLKKTLPDGSKVLNYSLSDRMHGKIILIIGLISAVIQLIFFLKEFE